MSTEVNIGAGQVHQGTLEDFRRFRRWVNLEAFTCCICKRFKTEKTGYHTRNLIYMCVECFNKETEKEEQNMSEIRYTTRKECEEYATNKR